MMIRRSVALGSLILSACHHSGTTLADAGAEARPAVLEAGVHLGSSAAGAAAWMDRCQARLERARVAVAPAWEAFARAHVEKGSDTVALTAEELGNAAKVPSDRTRFSIVIRVEPNLTERPWEAGERPAASVVHLTRVHRGLFARLESGAAYRTDHQRLIKGFQSSVDACMADGPVR